MGKSATTSRKTKRQLSQLMVELFENNQEEDYSLQDLSKIFNLKTHPSKLLCRDILEEMLDDDYLSMTKRHTYKLTNRSQVMTGTFHHRKGGRNLFIPDGEETGIVVLERNTMNALDGDRVKAVLLARLRNRIQTAEIIEITKRAKDTFVGILKVEKTHAFLLCDDRTLSTDIFIPKANLKGGKSGEKAVVKITEWPQDQWNPVGKVIDVLGPVGENDTEMHAILAEYGLPYRYPQNADKAAEGISDIITDEEISKREDFRTVTTFTIDPHDAKDFDDALSIRKLGKDLWEVGVHIADVTYYLKEGGTIDKEAYDRGTSVYLVDRTIPMLPEKLCNYICSLRPDEDKLAYSVIFNITESGEIKEGRIVRCVIRSNRRFAYEEVQYILEQNGEASEEDLLQPGEHPKRVKPGKDGKPVGDYAEELITLNRLAKIFREERFKVGGIDFDAPEVRFEIDEKGHPISTYIKVAKDANKLVEEFMLLANKFVAEKIGKLPKGQKAKPFVYRIHDVPDPEKLARLSSFVSKFGYTLKTDASKDSINKDINHLMADIQDKPEEAVIQQVALRSMMKARYSTHNIGHYGLMFRHYTHFTSPIRRYPDQMVHRMLTRYAENGRGLNQDKLEEQCEHCNEREQLATMAERASIKYKQIEFMEDKIGQIFEGKISGINEYGIYVELDGNCCEGMVAVRNLQDDRYDFDENNYCLVGRRYHHRYQLGDRLSVRIASANLEKRQLNFELEERI